MKSTLFLAIAMACTSFLTFAQGDKNAGNYASQYEIPSYYENGVKYSTLSKTPLAFEGISDPVTGNTAAEKGLDWITHHQRELQLTDVTNLVPYFEHTGPAGTTVRYRQHFEGVPVFQSEIVVHISPKNEVTYVTNTFDPLVANVNTSALIDEQTALDIASQEINVKGEITFSSSELWVYNREVSALVYRVQIEAPEPVGSWEVLVDAQTGNVLHAMNRACNHHDGCMHKAPAPPPVNGTGNVFIPDPLSFAQVAYAGQYVDGNDATNASLDATLTNVTLQDINFNGSQYQLVGPYAEIYDFESPYRGLFAQASPNFNFNRFDNGFEAVNCYYHIDGSMRYINETLNIPLMPFQYNGGVRYDPHGLNGADNSHYLGASGRVAFGEGGVDDAEDADVVLHELGHGLHDWLTGGNLSQVNGLSEGCGDYWASSYSRNLNQWTPADPAYFWMFSWDGHNPFWAGRITNYTALYPGGLTGAIHTDGQIWATSLLRIYETLGRAKVDAAFLEGLAMTGSNTNQQNAAIAVRQAAIDMGYSCADVNVFTVEFTATGYVLPALPQPSSTLTQTLCNGESIVVNGTTYNAANPSGTEVIPGAVAACDSTVTINLSFLPQVTGTYAATICANESVVINGTTYDANNLTGTEVIAGGAANGCDSTVTVTLSVFAGGVNNMNTTVCSGGSIVVNGTTYDANNPTGSETLINAAANGCDSVINVSLNFSAPLTGTLNQNLCSGSSITVNGTVYNEANPSGVEVFTNVGPFGCDSTVTINLTFTSSVTSNLNPTLCLGESVTVNGTVYNQANPNGSETFVNGSVNGCDSIVNISLSYYPAATSSVNQTLCDGESILVNGTTYNQANPNGVEVVSNGSSNGCDSTITVSLSFLPAVSGMQNSTICHSASITVNGTVYDANNPTGTEVFVGGAANGCDSTVNINLTVLAAIDITVANAQPTLSSNQSGASYQWIDCNNGNSPISGATGQTYTATANGSYAVQVTVDNCTETSDCYTVANVGLEENGTNPILVYPNPSTGIVNVQFGKQGEEISYSVTAVDGRIVRGLQKVNSSKLLLDLSSESKGVYFLYITQAESTEIFRLVLQ